MLTSTNGDCNDNNPSVWRTVTFYNDIDHDGYDAGSFTDCVGLMDPEVLPVFGLSLSTNGSDCDDNNAAVHSTFSFYADNDHDGYGAGVFVGGVCAVDANTPPTGYSTNFADCDDNNPNIFTQVIYYLDSDGDTYGSNNGALVCSLTPPPGYVTNNTDCNDNNAAINPATVWYRDADNDNYGDGFTQTQCARGTLYKLASELTSTTGDCDDNNPLLSCNGLVQKMTMIITAMAVHKHNVPGQQVTNFHMS